MGARAEPASHSASARVTGTIGEFAHAVEPRLRTQPSPFGRSAPGRREAWRVRVAVVLATRNGAQTLSEVLAAHARLHPPSPLPHRLVVVDNGSTDATPALLAGAAKRHPGLPLTVLNEPAPGKNRALNRALPLVAEADLVAFTDDDAVPEPDWLVRLVAAADAAPRHAVFGGAIQPRWMQPPPSWLLDWRVPLDVCYAANPGQREGPIPACRVWGPNMAVRGALLRQGHRFDTGIGPDGTATYPMGSEVEFTQRLERAGHPAWFTPHAIVHHLVRPEQMTEAWVLRRAYRCGLGAARTRERSRLRPPAGQSSRGVGGGTRIPMGLVARRWLYGLAAPVARRTLPPCRLRFWLQWQSLLVQGLSDGMRATAKEPPARVRPPPPEAMAEAPP